MLHEEQLEHGKAARRPAPVAAPSVLRRNAPEFHGFRQPDEQALVLVKFANLVLDEAEETRLDCQPVAREMLSVGFPRLFFHMSIISYNRIKSNGKCEIMQVYPQRRFHFAPCGKGWILVSRSVLRFRLCVRCSAGASGCAVWLTDDAKEGFCNYFLIYRATSRDSAGAVDTPRGAPPAFSVDEGGRPSRTRWVVVRGDGGSSSVDEGGRPSRGGGPKAGNGVRKPHPFRIARPFQ